MGSFNDYLGGVFINGEDIASASRPYQKRAYILEDRSVIEMLLATFHIFLRMLFARSTVNVRALHAQA
jgi:hypothetical protein